MTSWPTCARYHAAVTPTQPNLESRNFSEFSQWNESNGTLTPDTSKAYEGATSAKAVFDGKDSVSMFELTKLVNSHLKKG